MAAAIGLDLPINEPVGSVIVDLGAGTTETGVISLGGVVAAKALRLGGLDLNGAIQSAVRHEHERWDSGATDIFTDNELVNQVVRRGQDDLRMLSTEVDGERIAMAGVPWFAAPFGRELMFVGLETLLLDLRWAQAAVRFLERRQGIAEGGETSIASHFGYGTQDRDGPELFQNIRVANQPPLQRRRVGGGLVGADDLHHRWNLVRRKPQPLQHARGFAHRITDAIPLGQRDRVFRAMSHEHPQVMQPGGRIDDLVVILQARAQFSG